MNIGEKLLNLRKQKHLSQEEVAEKLNVSRQTISKWETNQSTPDFDKIIPLCGLYDITADELLTDKKVVGEYENVASNISDLNKNKRAKGIGLGILLYFVAIVWIMLAIPVIMMNPIVASAIFLLICGVATFYIVYSCIVYKTTQEKENPERRLMKQINEVIATIVCIIYFIVSFLTMAWHITWIIWVVYGLIKEIVKLIFIVRGMQDEK